MRAAIFSLLVLFATTAFAVAPPCPTPTPLNTFIAYTGTQNPTCTNNSGGPCSTGELINFSGNSFGYSFSNCEPVSFQWAFGDGGTALGRTPAYIYQSPGNYTVTLIVTTVSGTVTLTEPVHVTGPPVAVPVSPLALAALAMLLAAVAFVRLR